MTAVPPATEGPACARKRPCPSCPYRLDVPSGVWAPEEYDLLPRYDGDILAQATAGATAAFHCHSTPASLCSGWVAHRDPGDLLAVRLGVSRGAVDPSVYDYRTGVPLWPSGATAAAHGVRDVEAPSEAARAAVGKILRIRPDVIPPR